MLRKLNLIIIFLSIIILTGCEQSKINMPNTEKKVVTANYFGTSVEDPYRWLEFGNSQEVKDWIDEQNEYADKMLSGFPETKFFNERVKELSITSIEQSSPKMVNNKLFFKQITPPQAQNVIACKTWPDGEVEILVDPNKMGSDIAITDFWPSPGGNYLAYGTAIGGNEATTIHIMNLKSEKDLAETLPNAGGGASPTGLLWDADEKGLTYVHLPFPGTVPDSQLQFNAELYHHIIGNDAKDDKLVFGKGLSKIAEYTFVSSGGTKHAAMFVHFGDGDPDFVYLNKGNNKWEQVLDTSANVRVAVSVNEGADWSENNLLVISYQNAPKGKLISISSNGNSKTLVPEGEWAMNAVSAVKSGFLITKVLGADWKLDHYDIHGKLIRTVNLPKTGIGIKTISSTNNTDQALITYSGWTIPETWVQYNTKNGDLKNIFEVKPAADYSKVQTKLVNAESKDGTKIPVTILFMDSISPNGKRPTFVYAYGGFGISTKPNFIGSYLAWLENGGVIAYANIRGGGEFGEGWHEAGMLDKKQNCFDDMYAAANLMIKNNWTDSEHLGIHGRSNGGLLMGAELTQHPQEFKAVVSFVGIYDMLRNELFPNGQYNISEYGTSTKEQDFKWLYAFSPYHNIKSNTKYPAVLLESAVNDPRVAPWQSRKFAAALQSANNSNNPILLLTRMNEGHGVTSSFSQKVGNTVVMLAFFAHELGLKIKK